MKVYLDWDERYPVPYLAEVVESRVGYGKLIDIPNDLWIKWKNNQTDYSVLVEEIEKYEKLAYSS